jgi:hypothetical protein
MPASPPAAVTDRPTCAGCGDRIGVYEPVCHLTETGPESTSLLRLSGEPVGQLWHMPCAEAAGVAAA